MVELSLTNPYIVGGAIGLVMVMVSIFIIYWVFIRKRILSYIVDKHGGSWRIIKKIKKPLGTQKFDYKDGSYILDTKKAILNNRDNPILFYKFGNGEPLGFNPIGKDVSSNVLKDILESNSYSKLLSGYKENTYIMIIIALGVVFIIITGYQQITIFRQGNQISIYAEMIYNLTKPDDIFIPRLTMILRSLSL